MRRIALLAVLAAGGCSDGPSDKAFPGGAAAVLRSAKTVEAFRIDVPEREPGKSFEPDWWKWPMKAGPAAVDAGTAARLAQILLDDRSYHTGAPKACLPQPGVKFRFVDGARSVTLLVCYECRQFMSQNSWGGGGAGDFDPGAPALEEIAKELFPKDGAIQALTGLATPRKTEDWKGLAAGIEAAITIEAWLIAGGVPTPGGAPRPSSYFEYPETAGPVVLSKPAAAALTAILSDPKLVVPGARPCVPHPGVKFRFTRPSPYPVWVFLCFECSELFVYEGKAPQDGALFDAARSQLIAVLKPLFPKDEGLQGMK